MGELIMMLFHARTSAHVLHLKTRSYAVHQALSEFYNEVLPLTDNLAEVYQGCYGLIKEYPARYTTYTEPLDLLNAVHDYITKHRKTVCDASDTHVQNIIDEIVALADSTAYKLRFLK